MKLIARSSLLSSLAFASFRTASAFVPRTSTSTAFLASHHHHRPTTLVAQRQQALTVTNMANVLKLSEPQSQLLDNVDGKENFI